MDDIRDSIVHRCAVAYREIATKAFLFGVLVVVAIGTMRELWKTYTLDYKDEDHEDDDWWGGP